MTWEEKYIYPDLLPIHWAYENMMNASNGNEVEQYNREIPLSRNVQRDFLC